MRGVRTDKGEYGADVVVNAAGGWAAESAGMAGLDLPVKPDSHEAAVTEPVARFLNPMVVDIRPWPARPTITSTSIPPARSSSASRPNPSIWGVDTRETSSFLPMVARRMVDLMPRLQNIRVRRTWRGLYPMTPDGFPLVGWAREVEGSCWPSACADRASCSARAWAKSSPTWSRTRFRPRTGRSWICFRRTGNSRARKS